MVRNSLIYIFLFLWIIPAAGQESKVYNLKEVRRMAVFPGCEKMKARDKSGLVECFSTRLSKLLGKELKETKEAMMQSGVYEARTTLEFIVSKEGVILDITESKDSNPVLGGSAIKALESVSSDLPPIRPAMVKKGVPVDMAYRLPIVVRVNPPVHRRVSDFPVDEIVLFTLMEDSGLRYEVRLFKSRDIKVYELDDNRDVFLGKFLSMSELEGSEPYKSLMEKLRRAKRVMVADGKLEDGFYEIYMHNLFKNNPKEPIFVEIIKVENDVRTTIQEFEKEEDFNKSRFAPLIYRE